MTLGGHHISDLMIDVLKPKVLGYASPRIQEHFLTEKRKQFDV